MSIVGRNKEWMPEKNKATQEETRNAAHHAPRIVLTNPPRGLCNQSGSTNELEQVLFGTH